MTHPAINESYKMCRQATTLCHLVCVSTFVKRALSSTGWRRLIGCLQLQVIFHKRATKYRVLLRKMTCKDKTSYGSSPPCIKKSLYCIKRVLCFFRIALILSKQPCNYVRTVYHKSSRYTHTYIYTYIYIYIYIYIYVYIYIFIYVCVYIQTFLDI